MASPTRYYGSRLAGLWGSTLRRVAFAAALLLALMTNVGLHQEAYAQTYNIPSTAQPFAPAAGNAADMWRSVRQGISGRVTIPDQKAGQLVQAQGDTWRKIRNGPLIIFGALALLGVIILLGLFYVWRGRIKIGSGPAGRTIIRFKSIERFAHWTVAVSFVTLALTGLNVTFGKILLMPVIGKSAFATISLWAKYAHNYVAFAFAIGLALIFVLWIAENVPNRYDWRWLKQGGGILSKGQHPPARKFNAGQKILFWVVILGGFSIILSGIDLLFPFEMSLFSKTFAFINLFGAGLPTDLAPVHEMQLASIWHAVVAILMIAAIIGHIYIGTIGMEGAFEAMGTGHVDANWAREHHRLWFDEVEAKEKGRASLLTGSQGMEPAE